MLQYTFGECVASFICTYKGVVLCSGGGSVDVRVNPKLAIHLNSDMSNLPKFKLYERQGMFMSMDIFGLVIEAW